MGFFHLNYTHFINGFDLILFVNGNMSELCSTICITEITANAKDFEVIKKVHGFWVIQLKN